MGMITVSDLEEISKEDELEAFKKYLINNDILKEEDAQNLRAFYDHVYSPMVPTYCMIYPNTLPAEETVFGVADDDSRFASVSDLVSDDQIPTMSPTSAPTYAPTSYVKNSPTNAPTQTKPTTEPTMPITEMEYILAFELTYSPFDVNNILGNQDCMNYIYQISSVPCAELSYLNSSVRVSINYLIISLLKSNLVIRAT